MDDSRMSGKRTGRFYKIYKRYLKDCKERGVEPEPTIQMTMFGKRWREEEGEPNPEPWSLSTPTTLPDQEGLRLMSDPVCPAAVSTSDSDSDSAKRLKVTWGGAGQVRRACAPCPA